MKRIHDSLQRVFQRNRLVFWYDATKEWADTFSAFSDDSVEKIVVTGNEFGTKVRIIRALDQTVRFLLYIPAARPPDTENWLLDLLLQGYEYKADKASLALQEVGLPQEFRYLAEDHAAFFRSEKRMQDLKDLINKDDQAREIRLKMMAVLTGVAAEVDALMLHFLSASVEKPLLDPLISCFDSPALVEPFWREVSRVFGYSKPDPTIRDFAVTLFRGANPLDSQVLLSPHGKVFLQRWKDSQLFSKAFRKYANQMEKDLRIADMVGELDERTDLGDSDTFEMFEKFTLHRLCKAFAQGVSARDLQTAIQKRRASFWQSEHKHGYAALEQAVELRELLISSELTMDSLNDGLKRYVNNWWRIDKAYRLCTWNLRQYTQVQVMEQVSKWVEGAYINDFLLLLADRWGDQVRLIDTWKCQQLIAQRDFFETYIQPFREKGQKVFVIISDALRYEAARDFAERLCSANRWTAETQALFGSLPTYTQLGMASLLPGRERAVDFVTGNVTVDGRSASGTENRAAILNNACGGKAIAIQAKEFLTLNSKTEGRALARDYDLIYIFHDHIDDTGDSLSTEEKTFDAVEETFDELNKIIKKIANINGNNMLLTADHGFLFQQSAVSDEHMTSIPSVQELGFRSRRFLFGKNIVPAPTLKIFDAAALGVNSDWSAAFPLALGRFPLQGSGKRFVHGGFSLQEVVIPVVKIHKARVDDTEQIEVELLRVPSKITTGQLAISLYQDKAVTAKLLPRTLRIGVFSKDGTPLSEIKTHIFDSRETEARQREITILLVLSTAADAFNNKDVVIRLEEAVRGTSQIVPYKTHNIRVQKPFASDFDDD